MALHADWIGVPGFVAAGLPELDSIRDGGGGAAALLAAGAAGAAKDRAASPKAATFADIVRPKTPRPLEARCRGGNKKTTPLYYLNRNKRQVLPLLLL